EPWNSDHATPIAMTLEDIQNLKKAWVAAVKRALTAGFDIIEIHNAHVSFPRCQTCQNMTVLT
ncbi:MAG: hypothetical protein ACRYGR_07390, partial [Janthinobacterium lividum]